MQYLIAPVTHEWFKQQNWYQNWQTCKPLRGIVGHKNSIDRKTYEKQMDMLFQIYCDQISETDWINYIKNLRSDVQKCNACMLCRKIFYIAYNYKQTNFYKFKNALLPTYKKTLENALFIKKLEKLNKMMNTSDESHEELDESHEELDESHEELDEALPEFPDELFEEWMTFCQEPEIATLIKQDVKRFNNRADVYRAIEDLPITSYLKIESIKKNPDLILETMK